MSNVPEWKKKLYAARNEELPPSKPAKPTQEQGVSKVEGHGPSADGTSSHSDDHEPLPARTGKPVKKAAKNTRTSEAGTSRHREEESDPQPASAAKARKAKAKPSDDEGSLPGKVETKGKKATRTVARSETLSRGGVGRVLRNPRQALPLFQNTGFDVDDFIGHVYQDATDKGVEAAAHDLTALKDHCHQQVQHVVSENYQLFLECCQNRGVLDEAVTELRGHVQDATALAAALRDACHSTQQQTPLQTHNHPAASFIATAGPNSPGSSATPAPLGAGPGQGMGLGPAVAGLAGAAGGAQHIGLPVQPRPLADALETQLKTLLLQLDVAVAEQDYGTSVSVLGLASDVLSIISRDSQVLATEVGDVSNWRKGWETAVADHHRGLVATLEACFTRGGLTLSSVEMRGAAAALAALAGDVHAANVLLACHSERLSTVQSLLLRYHMSASTGSEEDAQQFAAALCQRTFLGIASAADDVGAVWGQSSASTAALLARWAEREARTAARAMRRQSLTPFVDGASLTSTAVCIQIGLVACGTLEMSHAVSVTAPFMAELWYHMEEVIQRDWKALAGALATAAQREVTALITANSHSISSPPAPAQHSGTHSATGRTSKATSASTELPCTQPLVDHLGHISRITVPFAGPKLGAVMRPGLLAALTALLDGVASGLQEAASDPRVTAELLASQGQGMMSHLLDLFSDDGPIIQALSPLAPGCGALVDLSELRSAIKETSTSLRKAGKAAQEAALEQSRMAARRQQVLAQSGEAEQPAAPGVATETQEHSRRQTRQQGAPRATSRREHVMPGACGAANSVIQEERESLSNSQSDSDTSAGPAVSPSTLLRPQPERQQAQAKGGAGVSTGSTGPGQADASTGLWSQTKQRQGSPGLASSQSRNLKPEQDNPQPVGRHRGRRRAPPDECGIEAEIAVRPASVPQGAEGVRARVTVPADTKDPKSRAREAELAGAQAGGAGAARRTGAEGALAARRARLAALADDSHSSDSNAETMAQPRRRPARVATSEPAASRQQTGVGGGAQGVSASRAHATDRAVTHLTEAPTPAAPARRSLPKPPASSGSDDDGRGRRRCPAATAAAISDSVRGAGGPGRGAKPARGWTHGELGRVSSDSDGTLPARGVNKHRDMSNLVHPAADDDDDKVGPAAAPSSARAMSTQQAPGTSKQTPADTLERRERGAGVVQPGEVGSGSGVLRARLAAKRAAVRRGVSDSGDDEEEQVAVPRVRRAAKERVQQQVEASESDSDGVVPAQTRAARSPGQLAIARGTGEPQRGMPDARLDASKQTALSKLKARALGNDDDLV